MILKLKIILKGLNNMAQKRMFDKKVVESDKFIDLPNSAKALYFMAGMDADDKGFFQPRKLQRTCGFADDDYKILLAKGFFITFESGVMVITDWNKNNWLDSRRVSETEYIDELKLLKLINDKYELISCLADAKPMLSEYSIEENSIEENSIDIYSPAKAEPNIPYDDIIKYLNFKTGCNYKSTTKKTKDLIKARINEGFTIDDFKYVIDVKTREWLSDKRMQNYLRPETLFSNKFESYLNQKPKELSTNDIAPFIDWSDF